MQFFCCLWIIVGGMDANANVTAARDDVTWWRWRTSARTHVKTRFFGGGWSFRMRETVHFTRSMALQFKLVDFKHLEVLAEKV